MIIILLVFVAAILGINYLRILSAYYISARTASNAKLARPLAVPYVLPFLGHALPFLNPDRVSFGPSCCKPTPALAVYTLSFLEAATLM